MSSTPQIGDFGVVRTGGLGGWAIRFGTRSTVNHAFVHVGNGQIVEAQPSGAVLSPVTEWPDAIWSNLDLTAETRAAIAANAKLLLGTPYGWPDIAALAFACYGIRSKAIDSRIERQDRLICSQLVDKAYTMAGVHLFNDDRLDCEVTPGDLLGIIRR